MFCGFSRMYSYPRRRPVGGVHICDYPTLIVDHARPKGVSSRFYSQKKHGSHSSALLQWIIPDATGCVRGAASLCYLRALASLSNDVFQPCSAILLCSPAGRPTCLNVIRVFPPSSSNVTVTSISIGRSEGIP